MAIIKTIPAKAGIGLRGNHHEQVMLEKPEVSWWEVHTENFFADGGARLSFLRKVAALYPMSFHGVGLSLGSTEKPDIVHLRKLKSLVDEFAPGLVSEHISWGMHNNIHANDLLPLPYNKESLKAISRNINYTQDFLGRQILIENPSSYLQFKSSSMTEWEFIDEIVKSTACGILLDVNNIYVSSKNNHFDPREYVANINPKHVQEIHLAGHRRISKNLILDTHSTKVCDDVWGLYEFAIEKVGAIPTLIEWDDEIPQLEVLQQEAAKAQNIMNKWVLKDEARRAPERIY